MIAVVALVVVGPERMPKLIRVTGLWLGRANASIQSVRSDISRELRADELRNAILSDEKPSVPRYIVPDEMDSSEMAAAEPVVKVVDNEEVKPSQDDNGKG